MMRRYTIVVLLALGAMLTSRPLLKAQATPSADFDANGIVDFGDFILFAQAFGSNQSSFDLDGSGAWISVISSFLQDDLAKVCRTRISR